VAAAVAVHLMVDRRAEDPEAAAVPADIELYLLKK
jgi:hypothetical protein